MRILRRLLIGLVVLMLLVLVGAPAAGYFYLFRRAYPQIDGRVALPGLSTPVEVIRDRWGIPHIYAQNEHDLFFAQGYVTAQDRLWQMEFNRRIGQGRLSEILGEVTLDTDRFIRTLGWHRTAQVEAQQLDPETREMLEAYAAGVNAFTQTHRDVLPPEFAILGVDPEPWKPVDSLVWGKVMAWDLGGNWESELLRARLVGRLSEEAASQLMPAYPEDMPLIVSPEVQSYRGLNLDQLQARLRSLDAIVPRDPSFGSNNWVIDGSLSATGMPLLANDPHLGIQLPSIWYEVHLVGGDYKVSGISLPGVPGVIIGHNRDIAWGFTNVEPDVQDLYLERINPADPNQYEYQGQWVDAQVVEEVIRVKAQDPVREQVHFTRHGPILSVVSDEIREALSEETAVAFRWTALEPNQLLRSILRLDKARNWEEFREALSDFAVPSQNVVYADREGNIGYQVPGWIPIRAARHNGLTPVPGWTGEYEWQGYIPYDELPRLFNPPSHYIVTANNKVVGDDYPYTLSLEWDPGFRAQRIIDLMSEKFAQGERLTIEDFQRIQADSYNLAAEAFMPYLLELEPNDFLEERALNELRAWDLRSEESSTGSTIFHAYYRELVRATFADELGEALFKDYLPQGDFHSVALRKIISDPNNPWFDDVGTPEREQRDEVVRRAFDAALDELGDRFGDAVTQWTWGRLHTATFGHITFEGVTGLSLIFDRGPLPVRGATGTVNQVAFSWANPFVATGHPSYRFIADPSQWSNSMGIYAGGQVGIPFHPHYADLIEPWRNVEYRPLLWERAEIEANREGTLTLEPAS